MYSFIEGNVASIHPTQVTLANHGIGYEVEISLKTFELIKEKTEVKLFIHQIVREDGHYLFGFHDETSKLLFKRLISVSGIGPNTARLILSGMSTHEVVSAITQESDLAFKRVKGVGPKTAKRIILDLKDKVLDIGLDDISTLKSVTKVETDNTIYDEALSALIALGFRRPQVIKAVKNSMSTGSEDLQVEIVIKTALKALTGGS